MPIKKLSDFAGLKKEDEHVIFGTPPLLMFLLVTVSVLDVKSLVEHDGAG